MPRLFDAYIMVDWSAAAKPASGANSIWIGILARDARLKFQFKAVNPDTRLKARGFIDDMVKRLTGRGDKVLLGFDFALGYPAGTAEAAGFDLSSQQPWQAMHRYLAAKVRERPDNSNARFAIAAGLNYAISKGAFPFWGAPPRDQVSTLAGKKPAFDSDGRVAEFRKAEMQLRATRRGQPKSVWQLAYTGSVGSQTLLGIPHVDALRQSWPDARIWPFETGLRALDEDALEGVQVVMTEIYPSLVKADPAAGEVADEAQMRAIARHYCDLDTKERLGALFGGPDSLDSAEISQIECEEGWILGA